mgnify:CR=1 FL=1
MARIMPEVVVQKLIQNGIDKLRQNPSAFNEIFATYNEPEMAAIYGQKYIDDIRTWFFTAKIPVVQAWAMNAQRIPCYSIHLATEQEDESKAAMGDYYGDEDDSTMGSSAFTVYVDIGVHADRSGDNVLWLYYILDYILFKEKLMAERLGLRLHTFSASDYSKDQRAMTENIWTRWVRFRCTVLNGWKQEDLTEAEPNVGIYVSRIGDEDGDEDMQIG